ncbi:MAG: type II secretion system protein J [Deltaproteobacteria bacterium]
MKGFTLLEVLVVIVIFSIVSVAIYNVFEAGTNISDASTGLLDLTQEARTAMFRMIKEVRAASAVTINNASGITFSTPFASNIQYYQSGTRLLRTDTAGSQVLASHVSNLVFSHPGGNAALLQVFLGVSKTVFLRPFGFSLIEQVRLRNE